MRELSFWIVGGRFDLGFEAFQHALEKGILIKVFSCKRFGVHDVAREIGEDDSPGERIFPNAGAQAA